MHFKDEEMTSFRLPKGIFYYQVMSLGLKNARATYQRGQGNTWRYDRMLNRRFGSQVVPEDGST